MFDSRGIVDSVEQSCSNLLVSYVELQISRPTKATRDTHTVLAWFASCLMYLSLGIWRVACYVCI